MVIERGTLTEFIEDITPFFYGKRITYVDVGAFKGVVFDAFTQSKLKIREAHLFEANPTSVETLRKTYKNSSINHLHIHHIAISDSVGKLTFTNSESMTRCVESDVDSEDLFTVHANTLDHFVKQLTDEHISVLKIDVEGHEKKVLTGAIDSLKSQHIDLIYIEAGIDKENKQQTYYREIDDILLAHGYKMFRIYEQMFEWIDDSPFLRRVNIAYMSERFAKNNPFRLSNQLFKISEDHEKLKQLLTLKNNEIVAKESSIDAKKQKIRQLESDIVQYQNELAQEKVKTKQTEQELRQKALMLELRLKSHLSYRLGSAIVQNATLTKFWRIPFAIFSAYQAFSKQKNVGIVSLTPNNTSSTLTTNTRKPATDAIQKESKSVLWHANQLMSQGLEREAIDFARAHAKGVDQGAVELLLANQHLSDELLWLTNINNYLSQFELVPIRLSEERNKSRFHRITADRPYKIDTGPIVSIIMPAYNAESYLIHSASSILAQTWQNIELIIIDDNSNDSTWEIMQAIAHSDARVKLIKNKKNVGPYVSKNYALDIAHGEFITGHDADDWAHPQRIEKHVNFMMNNREVKASLTRMVRMNLNGQALISKVGRVSDDGVLRLASISCMFDKSFLTNKLGYWDSVRFGADSELIARSEIILDKNFVHLRQLGMLCLDAEGSLTNHPEHGVCKINGVSPTRKYYRDQWMAWHKTISIDNAYISFPNERRLFSAPDVALVTSADILANKGNLSKNHLHEMVAHITRDIADIAHFSTNAVPQRFDYISTNFTYQFLWQPKENAEYLFVLIHGAKDRNTSSPPYFDRWSWANLFPGSVLNISDPTLELDDNLRVAWFIGNKREYPVAKLSEMVLNIAKANGIAQSKIIFWGSSCGGFTALALSKQVEHSTAVAINPQTNVLAYYGNHINEMLASCFNGLSKDQVKHEHSDRLDMVTLYKQKRNNKVLIVQNQLDEFHYKNHYEPFIAVCNVVEPDGSSTDGTVSVMLYSSPEGHAPETQEMVNTIMSKALLL